MPEIRRIELEHSQEIADKLRESAALLISDMPEIARILAIGADSIESLCDILKAQERLIVDLAPTPDAGSAGPTPHCPRTDAACDRGCQLGRWCARMPRSS